MSKADQTELWGSNNVPWMSHLCLSGSEINALYNWTSSVSKTCPKDHGRRWGRCAVTPRSHVANEGGSGLEFQERFCFYCNV